MKRKMLPTTTHEEAVRMDSHLRLLVTADIRIQRFIGQWLARLYDIDGLLDLAYAHKRDYVRERLGISSRTAQELVQIERLIEQFPEVEKKWEAGRINRCHVRLLVTRIKPEDDLEYACLATAMTVRQLDAFLKRKGYVDEKPEPSRDGRWVTFESTDELRGTFEMACDFIRIILGSDLSPSACLDEIVAHFEVDVPRHVWDLLRRRGPSLTRAAMQEARAMQQQWQDQRELARERATGSWSKLPDKIPDLKLPDFKLPEGAFAFDIDAGLREVVKFGQELENSVMATLTRAVDMGVPSVLGFDSVVHYGRERLGLSDTTTWDTITLGRRLRSSPEADAAFRAGELTRSQVAAVLMIATQPTLNEWLDYASSTTVRQLRKMVGVVKWMRKEDPDSNAHMRPPEVKDQLEAKEKATLDAILAKVAAQEAVDTKSAAHAGGPAKAPTPAPVIPTSAPVQSNVDAPGVAPVSASNAEEAAHAGGPIEGPTGPPACAPKSEPAPGPSAVPDFPRAPNARYLFALAGTIKDRIWIGADSEERWDRGLTLCRMTIGQNATIGDCLQLMVYSYLEEYEDGLGERAKSHPIQERDGWRCTTPICTGRSRLDCHHSDHQADGGSNDASNLITLCKAHHLKMLHENRMNAKGVAPLGILWTLGLRPNGLPNEMFVGDRVVYKAS